MYQLTSSLLTFLSLQTSVISRYASSRLAAMKLGSYLRKTSNNKVHIKLPSVIKRKSSNPKSITTKKNTFSGYIAVISILLEICWDKD